MRSPWWTYPVKFIMSIALTVYFAQVCLHLIGHLKEVAKSANGSDPQ